jgi:hypothetical protein
MNSSASTSSERSAFLADFFSAKTCRHPARVSASSCRSSCLPAGGDPGVADADLGEDGRLDGEEVADSPPCRRSPAGWRSRA